MFGLAGVEGRKVDMELTIRPSDAENSNRKFAVRFAQNNTYQASISFRPYESIVKVDRKFSGSRRAIVFVNDGEYILSATMYTDLSTDGISFLQMEV